MLARRIFNVGRSCSTTLFHVVQSKHTLASKRYPAGGDAATTCMEPPQMGMPDSASNSYKGPIGTYCTVNPRSRRSDCSFIAFQHDSSCSFVNSWQLDAVRIVTAKPSRGQNSIKPHDTPMTSTIQNKCRVTARLLADRGIALPAACRKDET